MSNLTAILIAIRDYAWLHGNVRKGLQLGTSRLKGKRNRKHRHTRKTWDNESSVDYKPDIDIIRHVCDLEIIKTKKCKYRGNIKKQLWTLILRPNQIELKSKVIEQKWSRLRALITALQSVRAVSSRQIQLQRALSAVHNAGASIKLITLEKKMKAN